MNDFPQELIDEICDFLEWEDIRSVYYVSTNFRKAANFHAWKGRQDEVALKHEDDPNEFIKHYSGYQLRWLDELTFDVHFGVQRESNHMYDGDSYIGKDGVWGVREMTNEEEDDYDYNEPCLEKMGERQEKDTAFTQQIQ